MKTRAYGSPYANPQSRLSLSPPRASPREPADVFDNFIRHFISKALVSTQAERHVLAKRFSAALFKTYPFDASARLSAREKTARLLVESIDWTGAPLAFAPFVPAPNPSLALPIKAQALAAPITFVQTPFPAPAAKHLSKKFKVLPYSKGFFITSAPGPSRPQVQNPDAGLAWLLTAELVLDLVYTVTVDDPFVVLMTLAMARAKMRGAFTQWSSQRSPLETQQALSFLEARVAQESQSIYAALRWSGRRVLHCFDLNAPASAQAAGGDAGVDVLLAQAVQTLLSQWTEPALPEAVSRLLASFGSDFCAPQAFGRGLASMVCSGENLLALRGRIGSLIGPGGWLGEHPSPLWIGVGEHLSDTRGLGPGQNKLANLHRVVETLSALCEESDLADECLPGLCLTHELSVECLLAADGTPQESKVARAARPNIEAHASPPWLSGPRQQADALLCRDDLRQSQGQSRLGVAPRRLASL